jgi:catechol 2,3-dioxygenase-like lactoylglutathione lyase family enzyme
MSEVSGFSHLVVDVTNLDCSEAFYRDVLGLEVIGRDFVNEAGPNSTLARHGRRRRHDHDRRAAAVRAGGADCRIPTRRRGLK